MHMCRTHCARLLITLRQIRKSTPFGGFRNVWRMFGGSGEIRTHGGLTPTAVFKTAALNHSATLPYILNSSRKKFCHPESRRHRVRDLFFSNRKIQQQVSRVRLGMAVEVFDAVRAASACQPPSRRLSDFNLLHRRHAARAV